MAEVAALRNLVDALIEAGGEEGRIDKVISDMENFFKIVSAGEEIRRALGSMAYGVAQRKAIVDEMGKRVGFDALSVNFLKLVIELGIFKQLLASERPFMKRLREASGRAKAEIVSTFSLPEEAVERIQGALKRITGKNIDIELKIDPSIIGGVIVKVEDKVFDGSIKSQLERMRSILSAG